jgi:NAD(P)-dependent dehydrogenase (short-subunit alcohol dehydrogenase family)
MLGLYRECFDRKVYMTEAEKKVALITGATGAIGKAIARQIAAKDYAVVLLARNETKAKRTVDEIIRAIGNADVRYEIADLSRHAEIQSLAARWQGPLHVLVNDAAVTPRSRQETPEGIEMQFATNVLGYFWMTQAFHEIMKASAPARIVDVASYWAGDLDIDDLEFRRRHYRNGTAYRQSKQANRMLVVAWAERLKGDRITINACHPGDVNSQLSNNLGFGGSESPDQGADTPAWLATEPIGGEVTGKYFSHRREERCRFGEDRKRVEALFEACLGYN